MNVDRMAIKTFVYLKLLGILNGCVLAKLCYWGKIKQKEKEKQKENEEKNQRSKPRSRFVSRFDLRS
jgi:hypothetical protein